MSPTPGVVTWFRVYCGALSLVYLAMFVGGIAFLFFGAFADHLGRSEEMPRALMVAYALVLIVLGAVFAAAFGAGAFLRPKPWVWVYGIVLISIGFMSACCLPFSVALLIFWLKPEAKAYFGRPV
jgi:MFS family permease